MTLQDKLYSLRRSAGYSQEYLAEKLGVSRQAVSKWERGESSPDINNVIALTELYDISADELIRCIKGEDSTPLPPQTGISLKKTAACAEAAGAVRGDFVSISVPEKEVYPHSSPADDLLSDIPRSIPISEKIPSPKTAENAQRDFTKNGTAFAPSPKKHGFFRRSTSAPPPTAGTRRQEICRALKKFPYWALALMIFLAFVGYCYCFSYYNMYSGEVVGLMMIILALSIPLYYTTINAVEKQDPMKFCYPLLSIMIYLFVIIAAGITNFFFEKLIYSGAIISALTIPLYYTAIAAYRHRSVKYYCFPVQIVMTFLVLAVINPEASMAFLWIFALIPFYYVYADKLDKLIFRK